MVVVEVVVASGVLGKIIGVTFVVSSTVSVTLVSSMGSGISFSFMLEVVLDKVLLSGKSIALVEDLLGVVDSTSVELETAFSSVVVKVTEIDVLVVTSGTAS